MKIHADLTTAGYPAEKNEKQEKLVRTEKSAANPMFDARDELELTSKKAAVLRAARETGEAFQVSEQGSGTLEELRRKLASVNSHMLDNPEEALRAQANLNPETVAELLKYGTSPHTSTKV